MLGQIYLANSVDLDREEEALAPVLLTWKHWPNTAGARRPVTP
jgi:hypothetical protein